MSDARAAIFAAIRAANGPEGDAAGIAAEAQALLEGTDARRPGFTGQSNLDRFIEKATSERVTATVAQVHSLSDVPGAVTAYLEAKSLPRRVAMQPRAVLAGLGWDGFEIHHSPEANEPVAVSIADLAVAETGSVVFRSAADAPVLMNFLPLHHLVVVETGKIRRHLEDVFAEFGADQATQPRNLSIVTGTSGTADIEAKNVRGAHGPRFMHLILVG